MRFGRKPAINAAVADAVMIGLATRLERGPIANPDGIAGAYLRLLDDEDFIAAYTRATADEERVARRLDLAISAFSQVS